MNKFTFIVFLFSFSHSYAGGWLSDVSSNCKIWEPEPSAGVTVKWSGECRNGKAYGNGVQIWYRDGKSQSQSEGELIDGKRNGVWRTKFDNGDVKTTSWVEGINKGKGTYVYSSGARYEGDFVDGMFQGYGKYTTEAGNTYEGEWNKDTRHGFGIYRLKSGLGYYISSDKSEIGDIYDSIVIGMWRNGKIYERYFNCDTEHDCKNKRDQERLEKEKQQRAWQAELSSKSPQLMYIKAGTYTRNGDPSKAMRLYEAIIDRFPDSQWAIKASDQLNAQYRGDSLKESLNDANRTASQRAYQQCKNEVNSCYSRTNGKGNCYRDCDSLR